MNHPLSHIHPDAVIGKNVKIDPFVYIDEDVIIGEGTVIGPHVTIMKGVRIGKNVKIFPGAVVGAIPQDLKFMGEQTLLVIGDNVTIREYCTINRGTLASGQTLIDDNSLIMAYVHVAHDCQIGKCVVLANGVNLAGHVDVGDYAILGGLSAVHQFVQIGAHSMVSGGSLVSKDVPPYVKAGRAPLSYVGINSIGLKRRGFDQKTIHEIQNIYRYLFVNGNNVTQAVKKIEAEMASTPIREEIMGFVKNSERGIMKRFQNLNGHKS